MNRQRIERHVPRPVRRLMRRLLGWARFAAARLPGRRVTLPPGALDCVVARNIYGVYCVPRAARHRDAAQAILQSRVWEKSTVDLMRSVDPTGDVVHAGTFFGDFLPPLARSRTDGALVWAFEPGDENHRATQVTMLLNGLENVILTHAALGAQAGTAVLATSDPAGVPRGGASRIIRNTSLIVPGGVDEDVKVLTCDEVIGDDRRVVLIQLDVEGYEQMALEGAMSTIRRCRPLILVETLPDEKWLADNLTPLGYRITGRVHANKVLRCEGAAAST